jgi:hypothetical protein
MNLKSRSWHRYATRLEYRRRGSAETISLLLVAVACWPSGMIGVSQAQDGQDDPEFTTTFDLESCGFPGRRN